MLWLYYKLSRFAFCVQWRMCSESLTGGGQNPIKRVKKREFLPLSGFLHDVIFPRFPISNQANTLSKNNFCPLMELMHGIGLFQLCHCLHAVFRSCQTLYIRSKIVCFVCNSSIQINQICNKVSLCHQIPVYKKD